jgi:hypothetical protein
VALLRQQLFVYRDLWKWINKPLRPPVDLVDPQLALVLAAEPGRVLDSRSSQRRKSTAREANIQKKF